MNILLLGISQAGKSTYGGQLALRFEGGPEVGALREQRRPQQIRALQAVVEALLDGRVAERTAKESRDRVMFHLQDRAGNEVNVVWPEFGGEAFKSEVLLPRALPPAWAQDTRHAQALLLLLRPAMEQEAPGLEATATPARPRPEGTDANADPTLVMPQPDARYVELLQLILHVRGTSRRDRASLPLVIGLTFWDELRERYATPEAALLETYPLLGAFLRGAWRPECWCTYGVSPQGRTLNVDQENHDSAFVDTGPAANGFVALPSGVINADLTLPLAWLAERTREG